MFYSLRNCDFYALGTNLIFRPLFGNLVPKIAVSCRSNYTHLPFYWSTPSSGHTGSTPCTLVHNNNIRPTAAEGSSTKDIPTSAAKHCKNCECCHHHSVFKGHNVIVHIVVLNCQKCNQCLKYQVTKTFKKSENFQKI